MIFISYSHKDDTWKDNVVKHLGVLAQDGQLALWDDRRIAGGDDWLPEIEQAIKSCSIALLLISADFLTSNFILGKEVPPLLKRREIDGVRVIPVILRPCAWDEVSWLHRIQARPKDGKALSSMSENDAEEALAALAREVKQLMKESPPVPAASPLEKIPVPTPTIRPNYHPSNPVFHVPFAPKGSQVIGRDEALAKVRQQLMEGRRTAIGHTASFKGLGGLGKTQLAVEYAYQYRDSYPAGVVWLNADQDIDAQLTELAVSAEWIAPESEHKDKLDVAKQRLRSHGDCLIIFDNLEEQKLIHPYLPNPSGTAHILVTSRLDQPGFTPIPIDPLDQERSLELLCQESCRRPNNLEEVTAAREIVTILGGLPLAIELAGAYLCHRRAFPFADYLARLRDDPLKALPERYLSSFTGHDPDLFRTLKINEELFVEELLLTPILDLLTWSGPASMGIELMARLLEKSFPELRGALAFGVELRIIQKSPDVERYAIHRLVREVRKVETPLTGRIPWAENIANRLGDWFQELREEFKSLPRFEAEIDHLIAWCDSCRELPRVNARLTWLQAYPPYHRGNYLRAHETVKLALSIVEKGSSEPNEVNAHIYNDYGATLQFIGDFKTSIRYQEQALSIRKELFGDDHRDTAASYNNVGSTYGQLGAHKEALEFVQKALELSRKRFGDNHRDTAASYNNVGNAYGRLGDQHNSLKYLRKAHDIIRNLFGDDHPDTATSYDNVGIVHGKLNNHKDALLFKQKALEIRRALFGDNHPDTAKSLCSIGVAYYHLGKPQLALAVLNKALSIGKCILPASHPLFADIEQNLRVVRSNTNGFRVPPRQKRR